MKLHRLFTAAILFVLLIGAAALSSPPDQVALAGKVEPQVLEELSASSQTDFFIWMAEKADLSPAAALSTKLEKGRFVFDALRVTAERTQRDLLRYLDGQGIKYQSFYISNKILVYGGDQVLLNSLASRVDVAQITANHQYQLQEPFKNPSLDSAPLAIGSNISFIKAPQVWALGYSGQGTVMAGNDTGLDEAHPAIARHYRGCLNPPTCSSWDHNYNWWDATGTYPTNPFDGHGHGTHTTGTMVGDDGSTNQIGVAPGAQTIHCKNMTDGGSGSDATFTTCFQWDLAPWNLSHLNPDPSKAPDAINNSWGYGGGNQNQFRDEILALHAAGILVEVSAGNEGPGCATLRSPGDYSEVLTTGSVNHASAFPGTMTSFSSRGPSDLDGSYFPDVTAPGESIRSSLPNNSYANWSGTSMAGPHATALIGLMWSACPSLQGQVSQTIGLIKQTAVSVNYTGSCGGNYTTGPNNDWGEGTIDALAAVQAAINQCGGGTNGTLQGTITDASTGLPIAGATVTAGSTSDTTDANGFYQMTLPAGTYNVTASASGYTSQTASGVVVTAGATTTQNFALAPVQTSAMHVSSIALSYTIKGKRVTVQSNVSILDQNGNVVPSATVFGDWTLPDGTLTAQSAATNTSGVATLRVVTRLRGLYEICVTNVTKAGYVYDPAQNVETCDVITVP